MEEPPPAVPPEPAPPKTRRRVLKSWEETRGKRWVPVVALVAFVVGALLLHYLRALPESWTEVKALDGSFSIEFPDDPKASKAMFKNDAGFIVANTYVFTSGYEDEAYKLETFDFPAPVAPAGTDKLLDESRDAAIGDWKKLDPVLKSSTPWAFEGNPGRAFTCSLSIGAVDGTLSGRAFLVGGTRLYLLTTAVHTHHVGENDARFLASFKLLKR
jgi:hypothetical protein